MSGIIERIKNEPVAIVALVEAVVYAATEFGLELSSGQQAGILGVVAAVLTIVARQKVTPTRSLPEAQ